mmetsp:Transcript_18334/g.30800  ORF Transcript_18334/g.30800 Transcript_18334/m.30800 type:complete len:563 (+) Transcript_18334:153-1841(+)
MTTKATLVASAVAVAGLAVYYRNDCWQRGVLSIFQSPRKTYEDLCDELKALSALGGCMALLEWDELVMMADGSADARAEQKAALAEVIHERSVSKTLKAFINAAKSAAVLRELDEYEAATVRDAERDYLKAVKTPKALARLEAELSSQGYQCWVKAREANDWALFAPMLERILQMRKQIAAACAPNSDPYDFCIDNFERGLSHARLQAVLSQVKEGLVPLIQAVTLKRQLTTHKSLKGKFDVAQQEVLSRQVAAELGFSFEHGRFDKSVHPFTGGTHPTDTRITTRFEEDSLISALMGTVHETGHAMYEQQRNTTHADLPVSMALSMGVHESQSLLWERMVGQSKAFWTYLTPLVHNFFPQTRKASAEELYQFVNVVKPSLIRVDADELTYPLHIIVRFELEKELFDGSLLVKDLPQAWNQKYQEYLGVAPPTDAEGVLQDVHWSDGSFGYFPSYTLGAMFACQFYQAALKELPGLEKSIALGDFRPLKEWLGAKIHQVGSLHPSADELCLKVTGEVLNPQVFIDYLTKKYTELYDLSLPGVPQPPKNPRSGFLRRISLSLS